jgi:hypothetical protein
MSIIPYAKGLSDRKYDSFRLPIVLNLEDKIFPISSTIDSPKEYGARIAASSVQNFDRKPSLAIRFLNEQNTSVLIDPFDAPANRPQS